MGFYQIKNIDIGLGDWGDILLYGFAPTDAKTGRRYIERVGPVTPPIYIVSDTIIVTEKMGLLLKKSGLTGFDFGAELEKKKVVDICWSSWLVNENKYLEKYQEPEDIIFKGRHSKKISDEVGLLRELLIGSVMKSDDVLHDFNRLYKTSIFFVSQQAREWLEANCDKVFIYKDIEDFDLFIEDSGGFQSKTEVESNNVDIYSMLEPAYFLDMEGKGKKAIDRFVEVYFKLEKVIPDFYQNPHCYQIVVEIFERLFKRKKFEQAREWGERLLLFRSTAYEAYRLAAMAMLYFELGEKELAYNFFLKGSKIGKKFFKKLEIKYHKLFLAYKNEVSMGVF